MKAEFTCQACGHNFNPIGEESIVRCPRCGGTELERNPFLFGTPEGGLAPEDYFDVCLAPCCQPNWLGWRSNYQCSLPLPDKDKVI